MIALARRLPKTRTVEFLRGSLTVVNDELSQAAYRQSQSSYWKIALVILGIGVLVIGVLALWCYCQRKKDFFPFGTIKEHLYGLSKTKADTDDHKKEQLAY